MQSGLQPGDVRGQRHSKRGIGVHRRPGHCASNARRPVTPGGEPKYPEKQTSGAEGAQKGGLEDTEGRQRSHVLPDQEVKGSHGKFRDCADAPGRAPGPCPRRHSTPACERRTPSFLLPQQLDAGAVCWGLGPDPLGREGRPVYAPARLALLNCPTMQSPGLGTGPDSTGRGTQFGPLRLAASLQPLRSLEQ